MKNMIIFPLSILFILILSFTFGCMSAKVHSKAGTITTIILIRHADRDDQGQLSEKGQKRSESLIESLKSMDITAIYSPKLRRNLDTVQPLANHLGIEITLAPKTSLFSVDTIAKDILDKHAGGTVLWVGNVSGNLQAMYHRLGGKGRGPLEYGEISILIIPDKGEVKESMSIFEP